MPRNKIIIKTSKNEQPYVVVKGGNNETIAITETYKSKRGAEKAAETLKRVINDAIVIDKTK